MIHRSSALLALACLVPLACQAQPQGASTGDLAVRVDLDGSVPEWIGSVGGSAWLTVNVTNRGPAPALYRIDLEWLPRDSSVAMPLNGDAARSFDAARQPLGPGAWRLHAVPWTLQPGQAGHGAVRALVSGAEVEARPQDNKDDEPVFVPVRRVVASLGPAVLDLAPDASGFVRILLANEGNQPEPVALGITATAGDARLKARLSDEEITVPPASTAAVHALVTFRPDGDFSPAVANFTIEADTAFAPPVLLRTPDARGLPDAADLSAYAAEVVGEVSGWHVAAGGTIEVPLRVRNVGTRPDNYTVLVQAAPGWDVEAVPADICLLADEQATLHLRVRAPLATSPGTPGQVEAMVRPSLAAPLAPFRPEVLVGGPSPAIESLSLSRIPYVGLPVRVQALLANHGDEPLPAGSLTGTWTRGTSLHEAPPASSPSLRPGERRLVELTLPPPTSGGAIEVQVRWPASGPAAAHATVAAVVHDAELEVTVPEPLAGAPGEVVAYRLAPNAFRVTNHGNADELVALSVAASNGSATLAGPSVVALAPGESRTVPVEVRLPDPAGLLTEVRVEVTAAIPAAGASWQAAVATAVTDAEPPRLRVLELPRLWSLDAPLDVTVDATDQAPLSTVRCNVTAPGGTSRTVLLVPSGAIWRAALSFMVAGNHTLVFMAADAQGNNITSRPHLVQAAPVPAPRVAFGIADRTRVAPDALLRIDVTDTLALHPLAVTVVQGTHREDLVLRIVDGSAAFHLDAPQEGPMTVQARATNWAGASTVLNLTLEVRDAALAPQAETESTLGPARRSGALEALPGLAALAAIAALRRRLA